MGAFAQFQPLYAEHHVTTFPVDDGTKKPSISRPQRVGPSGSRQLVLRFPANDALGFWAGPRNGLTVLDVDVPDERVLADRLSRHGETPLVVRSPSGKFHAYYRHNGERRVIRDGGTPVDILGAGLVIAPPSNVERGCYQIIRGGLDDLDRLPVMRGLAADHYERPVEAPTKSLADRFRDLRKPWGEMRKGDGRNPALQRYVMRSAQSVDSLDDLLDDARTRNEEFAEPLPDGEIASMVRWAWQKTLEGKNLFGRGQSVILEHAAVDALAASEPDAFAMLAILRRYHEGIRDEFVLAQAAGESWGWDSRRFKRARTKLEELGHIRCIHPGGRGRKDPPVYCWGKGCKNVPQY